MCKSSVNGVAYCCYIHIYNIKKLTIDFMGEELIKLTQWREEIPLNSMQCSVEL